MNIVYLNPGGSIGGAEMCLLDVLAARRVARADDRLAVLLGDDGPLRDEVERLGIPCDVLPLPAGVARLGDSGASGLQKKIGLALRGLAVGSCTLGYRNRLARRLRDERPDLVQSNGMKTHVLGAWAAPRDVPVVWHLHDFVGRRPAMARLLRLSARSSVQGVAVSEAVAADVRATLGPRFPVRTIYNAVDLDRFRPETGDGAELDRASGLPEAPSGTVRVGLMATFATWKGHDVFLDAASRVPTDRPARFYIIGGPIYRSTGSQVALDDLKANAGRLGLGDRVGFTGHQADPVRILRGLDVVVHASTQPEPFGRVIVEGMATGRAVVAMTEGGAAELFTDGIDALGCPPRDAQRLSTVLRRLIDDPELRRTLGRNGRETATARFDRRRLSSDWSAVYDADSSLTRSTSPAVAVARTT